MHKKNQQQETTQAQPESNQEPRRQILTDDELNTVVGGCPDHEWKPAEA